MIILRVNTTITTIQMRGYVWDSKSMRMETKAAAAAAAAAAKK